MSLKILTSLADLFMETHNRTEALEYYMIAIKKNPLALNTLKKFLKFSSCEEGDQFVRQICKTINDSYSSNDSTPLCNYITAHNLARLPKNFKTACQMFFTLRSSNNTAPINQPFFIPDTITEAG